MSSNWLAFVLNLVTLHFSLAIIEQQHLGHGAFLQQREKSLEREWGKELEKAGEAAVAMSKSNGTSEGPSDTTFKNPMYVVVDLLKKMRSEIVDDQKYDQRRFDETKCWCRTMEEEAKNNVKYDKSCIRRRTDEIEERSTAEGVMVAQLERMEIDMARLKISLIKSDGIRKEEAIAFHKLNQDLTQTIINGKNARTILQKHHDTSPGASFMQNGSPLLTAMQSVLRDLAVKHELVESKSNRTEAGDDDDDDDAVLLSLKSRRSRISNDQTTAANQALSEQDRVLMDALDVRGGALTVGILPVQFAQQAIAKSAKDVTQGGFLQTNGKQPNTFKSYSSRSGMIFGILDQMLDDFEHELAEATAVEAKEKKDFDEMQAAGYAQLNALKEKSWATKVARARNIKRMSDAKMYLQACYREEVVDGGFLGHLQSTCNGVDQKFREQRAERQREIDVLTEVINTFYEGDVRATLVNAMKYFNQPVVGFLQESSTATQKHRSKALDVNDLMAEWNSMRQGTGHQGNVVQSSVGQSSVEQSSATHANVTHKKLAALSTMTRVQKDGFKKVRVMMERMITNLVKEQGDEVKFKATCLKDLHENKKSRFKKNEELDDLGADLDEIEKEIEDAVEVIKKAQARIAKAQPQFVKLSAGREEENKNYQMMMSGQYATQEILTKVVKKLRAFYNEANGGIGKGVKKVAGFVELIHGKLQEGDFVQLTRTKPDGAGVDVHPINKGPIKKPAEFKEYTKNTKGATSVIGLIEKIIEDSKKITKEAIENEASSQKDYEASTKEFTDEIANSKDEIRKTEELLTQKNWEKTNKLGEIDSTREELDAFKMQDQDLHDKCDFVLKNFDTRQFARRAEIEGIQGAKANLEGGMVIVFKDCSREPACEGTCWDQNPERQIGNECCSCPSKPDFMNRKADCSGTTCSGMSKCQDGGDPRTIGDACCVCPEFEQVKEFKLNKAKDCTDEECPATLCWDMAPARLIGTDCCACPPRR